MGSIAITVVTLVASTGPAGGARVCVAEIDVREDVDLEPAHIDAAFDAARDPKRWQRQPSCDDTIDLVLSLTVRPASEQIAITVTATETSTGRVFDLEYVLSPPADDEALQSALAALLDELAGRALTPAELQRAIPALEGLDATPTGEVQRAAPSSVGAAEVLPWVLGGLGVAGLGTGLYFGVEAQRHADRAKDRDRFGAQRNVQPAREAQLAANISYGLGGALIVSGVLVWWLAADDGPRVAAVPNAHGGAALVAAGSWP